MCKIQTILSAIEFCHINLNESTDNLNHIFQDPEPGDDEDDDKKKDKDGKKKEGGGKKDEKKDGGAK